jgi:enamine deaminase RidA (YjgF/YER057c/UK114 family)
MENQEWQEIVQALVDAKRCLATAWRILDGTDSAAPGVEQALNAALASIDAVYAIERVHDDNADVASLAAMQEFWAQRGELPGFAIGT